MRHIISTTAILVSLSLIASAASADRMSLLDHKDWRVDLVSQDGFSYCDAYTMISDQTWFSIYAFDGTGNTIMEVRNSRWDLSPREASLYVDVDYSGFHGIAEFEGEYITLGGLSYNFLEAIADGNAIALKDDAGRNILTFSLRGSAAALYKLVDCMEAFERHAVSQNAVDPFARSGAGRIGDQPQVFGR